jgi:hypothetical protein
MKKLTNAQHAQDRLRLAEFLAKHKAAAMTAKAATEAREARSQRAEDVIPWIG